MVDAIAAIGAVVLLAIVTMATRVGGVWIMSYVEITPRIEAFLKYMSVSVLVSIVATTTWAVGCGTWLRANTRDAKKFPLLFGENVGYGFRRNLLGLKWPALVLNVIVVAICAAVLWLRGPLDMDNDLTMRTVVVLVIAALHATYFGFVVTKDGVNAAARKYARELILSTEALIGGTRAPAGRYRRRISTQ